MNKDSIKKNLQTRSDRPKKRVTVDQEPILNNNSDHLRRLHNISSPVTNGENPTLGQIENSVSRLNNGQRQFEIMKKMDESPMYKTGIQVVDNVKGWFGNKPVRIQDIYQLFDYQQGNVRELNTLLSSMTTMYTDDVDYTRNELNDLIKIVTKESNKKINFEKEVIPPSVKRYEHAMKQLKEHDRNDNPDEFYTALQSLVNVKRDSRKTRFEYVITSVGKQHHEEQIENLMLQEELFETMLYGVMKMAVQTELYQRTLDDNIRIWKPIGDIARAVRSVSDGVNELAKFNYLLNESYINTIRDVATIINTNPGAEAIVNTNNDLRTLVNDVNASDYQQGLSYTR